MKIEFTNSSRSTRNGFAHDTKMYINDRLEMKATCHYINRTWEAYRFQSVMQSAIYLRIEVEKQRLIDEYKSTHNKKRLSKEIKDSLTNEFINQLKAHKL